MLRGQLLFQPSDDLSFRLIGDYSKRNEECCAAAYLPAHDHRTAVARGQSTIAAIERALGATIIDDPSIATSRSRRAATIASDVKDGGVSGEIVYDFGGAELTSITAYRYNKYTRGQDADFNNLDILFRDDDGGAFNRFKTFTQELRLQGNAFDNRLDWLVGGYYANEKLAVDDNLAYGPTTPATAIAWSRRTSLRRFDGEPPCTGHVTELFQSGGRSARSGRPHAAVQRGGRGRRRSVGDGDRREYHRALRVRALEQRGLPRIPGRFQRSAVWNSGFSNLTTPLLTLNGAAIDDSYRQTSNNWAVFTHNIFSITDRLKLTLGARYTHERKKLNADLNDNNHFCTLSVGHRRCRRCRCVHPSVPGGSLDLSDHRSESKISGTAVISYKPTDRLLTYASYSRGYKAGGFNLDRSALFRALPSPVTTPASSPPLSGNGAICVCRGRRVARAFSRRARICSSSRNSTTRSRSAPSTTVPGST